jgi:hypothetical protein
MKKEGFNPRINSENNQTKNIFKMSVDELELQNQILEKELKNIKKGSTSNKLAIETKSQNSSKKKINLVKTKSPTEGRNKNSNFSNLSTHTPKDKIKVVSNYKLSNPDDSLLSFNSTRERENTRSNSKNKTPILISNFKNKLNSTILNVGNLEINISKTSKNLIPVNSSHNHNHNPIDDSQIKNMVSKLKICQKHNLPNEKNYFVSEKNLKLIEEALSEKESDINNLKALLSFTKNDIDSFQKKYDDLYQIIEELENEKNILLTKLENLLQENKQLKDNYDDFSFQYNKIIIYFKKIENFLAIVFKWYDSFKDKLKNEENEKCLLNNTNIVISPNSRFMEIFKNLHNLIQGEDGEGNKNMNMKMRDFNFLFTHSITNSNFEFELENKEKLFLYSNIDSDYLKMEKMNKQLKNKLYDYENFLKKLSHIYETKNVDLTDIAKDMIETKKRITDLDTLNENLEKENDYLRISYHNLYVYYILKNFID